MCIRDRSGLAWAIPSSCVLRFSKREALQNPYSARIKGCLLYTSLDALEKAKEPTLSDLLVDYFNLRNEQRTDWSGKAKLKCTVQDFEERCV